MVTARCLIQFYKNFSDITKIGQFGQKGRIAWKATYLGNIMQIKAQGSEYTSVYTLNSHQGSNSVNCWRSWRRRFTSTMAMSQGQLSWKYKCVDS